MGEGGCRAGGEGGEDGGDRGGSWSATSSAAGRRIMRGVVLACSGLVLCALCTTLWLNGGDKWRGGAELEERLLGGVVNDGGMKDLTKSMRREFAKEDQELENQLGVARLPRIHSGLGSSEMASYLNSDTSGGDRKKAAEYRLQLKYAQDDKDFHSSRLAASFDQSGDPLSALYMTKYRALNSAKKGSSLFPMLYAVGEDTNQEGGERSGGVRDEDYQAILQGANNAAAQLSFRDELKSDEQNSRGYMKKLETDFLQSQNNGPGFQSLLQLSRLRSDRPRYPSYDDTITSWADRRSSEGLSGNIPHDSSRVHSESRLEARAPFQQLSMGIGSTGEGEEDGNAKDWIVAMESDPKCKKIVEQIRHGILGALLDDSTDCLANKKKPKAMWPFGSPGDKWEVKDQGVQEKSNLLILAARKLEKEREKLKDADNEKEEAKRDALQAVKTEGALQAQVDSLYHNEKKQRKDFANVAKMAQSTVLVEEEMIGKLVKALKDEKQSVSEMQRQNLLQQLALKRLHQSFEHGHQGQNGEWYIPWTKQLASAAQAARPYSEA